MSPGVRPFWVVNNQTMGQRREMSSVKSANATASRSPVDLFERVAQTPSVEVGKIDLGSGMELRTSIETVPPGLGVFLGFGAEESRQDPGCGPAASYPSNRPYTLTRGTSFESP